MEARQEILALHLDLLIPDGRKLGFTMIEWILKLVDWAGLGEYLVSSGDWLWECSTTESDAKRGRGSQRVRVRNNDVQSPQ